jgi:hypothetical protein
LRQQKDVVFPNHHSRNCLACAQPVYLLPACCV